MYVSPELKRRVARETAKRNIRFLGRLGKLAGKRTIETGNLVAAGGVNSAGQVAKDIVAANKETLLGIKDAAKTLGGGNNATPSDRIKTAADIALDLIPTTAIGRRAVTGLHEATGKRGRDVVQGMAEFATNPSKSIGRTLGHLREGGHGGKMVGGKWIGPGVNKWCLGIAPDSVVSSVGAQFEEYKGADNLRREVEALVNSKDGRRFARTYDRRLGRYLNPAHDLVSETTSKVPSLVDGAFDRIKEGVLQPQPVPVRAFSEKKELELPWTKENIARYRSPENMLRHTKTGGGIDGVILVTGDKKELIGYIAWKKDYIQALEVPDRFKRSGYGERLLKMAIKSGARKLSVRKGNLIAIKLYEKLGFRKTKDLNPVMIEMEL